MVILFIMLVGLSVCSFLFYASYSISSGVYLRAYCRLKTGRKTVALTFDDGPDKCQTPLVLDVLKSRKVPATFFCIGNKLAGNESIIHRIDAEGHFIGNHSYSHTWKLPFYPVQKIKRDLNHCQDILQSILNKDISLFRPPFGVTNPLIARAVKELGYTVVGWDIRTLDTQDIPHERILKRIRQQLRPGSIILLHDRMPQADILLVKILDLLDEEEYQVVGLDDYLIKKEISV